MLKSGPFRFNLNAGLPRCHEALENIVLCPTCAKPRGLYGVLHTTSRDVIVLPKQTTVWLLRAMLTLGSLPNPYD